LLPNLITFLRLALVPAMAWALARGDYGIATIVFLAAAVSDLLDGFIARRFHLTSRLGAALDPVADKLNMFVATVILAMQDLVPLWLAVAIVLRDVVIVVGAGIFRAITGAIEFKPTRLSKVNTALEFALLLAVMANAAGGIDARTLLAPAFYVVFATVIASGLHYVWAWALKAKRAAR
jgi:cardiolipin synthase